MWVWYALRIIYVRTADGLLAVDKSYALFKSTLLRHSVQRPPYSVGVFTLAEIKSINDYVLNGCAWPFPSAAQG